MRNCSATPNSTTSVSRLTHELFPSFTFGSQGEWLESEGKSKENKKVTENAYDLYDFDCMSNIFYDNSVSHKEKGKFQFRKISKLCLQKKLEKRIFKVKAKSIFKNLFFKKFGMDSKKKISKPSSSEIFSVKDTIFLDSKKNKTNNITTKQNSKNVLNANISQTLNKRNFLNISLPVSYTHLTLPTTPYV